MPVKGIERVRKGFKVSVDRIASSTTEGAVYSILSQGAALAQTMTPIDTSNLINSQYAPQIDVQRGKVTGNVGYTAEYAGAVHDAPGTLAGQPRANGNGDYWDPNAEPGFLEKGFEQVKPSVPDILRRHYRV
ncbi:hypothetical protein [Stutzerimonas nitrititolerans]|uniref:hypothetical protein n=1 Tax=Stutzerimonas nitrititolerans TaxID=2482751 RepID=UPI0028AA1343|nr:hypothetical protein [Stutzerimonas nitrititolerans]